MRTLNDIPLEEVNIEKLQDGDIVWTQKKLYISYASTIIDEEFVFVALIHILDSGLQCNVYYSPVSRHEPFRRILLNGVRMFENNPLYEKIFDKLYSNNVALV